MSHPVESYHPAWWIPGPHAQTLWGKFVRRPALVPTRVERWETPDGDFVDLHRLDAPARKDIIASGSTASAHPTPRVLLLHGLEGTIRSHYAQGILTEMHRRGWAADMLVFRSCGNELNRTRRFYHSGETTDLDFVIQRILREDPNTPLALVGVSLGGNVLLKYLGERGKDISPRIVAAAAVSVPYDLARGSRHISQGFSKVYEQNFLRSLKEKVHKKLETFPDLVDPQRIHSLNTLFDFDDAVTARVHGFASADDYYARSSAIRYIHNIAIDTLLLSAIDDPFLPAVVLDEVRDIARDNDHLHVEFVAKGGHVGFVGGWNPFNPVYYLERRVGAFFAVAMRT